MSRIRITSTDPSPGLLMYLLLVLVLSVIGLGTMALVAGGLEIAALGACYGFTYQPLAWYASGFDLCFNVTGSQTAPTLIYPSGTVHFLGYGSITVGPQCLDGTCQWHLLFGGNLALGFGAGTAAEQRAKASAGK